MQQGRCHANAQVGYRKLVNTTTSGNQTWARVTELAGGGYVVVWEDDGLAFSAIRAQMFDTAGNRVGSEIAVIVPPGNQEITPAVTGLADGGFAVTWTQLVGSSNYVLGSIYDAHGTFVRSQPAAFGGDQIANGEVTRFGSGTAVVWEEPAGFTEIDFRTFDAAGTGSAVQRVNIFQPGDRHDPTIAASPDQSTLAIAWDDQGSIRAALVRISRHPDCRRVPHRRRCRRQRLRARDHLAEQRPVRRFLGAVERRRRWRQ